MNDWPTKRVDEMEAGDVILIEGLGEKTIKGFTQQAWMNCPRVHFEDGSYAVVRADKELPVKPREK